MENDIKKIAIIDDDESFIYVASKLLDQLEIPARQTFTSGISFLEFIKANANIPERLPDIIILDISMPLLDGFAFLKEYQSLIGTIDKAISIYICTSNLSPGDKHKLDLNRMISGCLIKPLTKENLMSIITKTSFA